MMNYDTGEHVDKWKTPVAWVFDNLHPSLLMALFMFVLQHAINTEPNPVVVNWIAEGLRSTVLGLVVSREAWSFGIGACMVVIVMIRPGPVKTLILSSPAGAFAIFTMIYGWRTDAISWPVLTMVFFAWLGVGLAMMMLVVAERATIDKMQAESNCEKLRRELETLKAANTGEVDGQPAG